MDNEVVDEQTTPPSCPVDLQRRNYNRNYYHEHKVSVKCEYCDKEFSCRSGLVRHQRRSHKCRMNKLQKYITGMEGNLPCGISFNEIANHLISQLEMA